VAAATSRFSERKDFEDVCQIGGVQRLQSLLEFRQVLPLLEHLEQLSPIGRSALLAPCHRGQHTVTMEELLNFSERLVETVRIGSAHPRMIVDRRTSRTLRTISPGTVRTQQVGLDPFLIAYPNGMKR
jgi:hypothetical protein